MTLLALQTTTFNCYGGIPTYNRFVCRALSEFDELGERRVLVAMDGDSDLIEPRRSRLYDQLQIEAFNGNRWKFSKRAANLAARRKTNLMLVGHVNYAPLAWLLRFLRPEMRYGVVLYGTEVWETLPPLRRRALRQADFAISISEYTKQQAVRINNVAAERIHLLPNALEYKEEPQPSPSHTPLPSGTLLLAVCRLDASERQKGVDTVIEALPEVLARVPDAQFIVVGGGTDVTRHEELARRAGVASRVHFTGFVDDAALRAYYEACDIFVMPSAQEGFGFVFLEAMRYGKPIVAARNGGVPEVVEDGVTGVLISFGDVAQTAESLVRLCLDAELRVRLGRTGRARLDERFTFSRFKDTLNSILRREAQSTAPCGARPRVLPGAGRGISEQGEE